MEPRIVRLDTEKPAGAPLMRELLYQGEGYDFNWIQVEPGLYKEPHPYAAGDSFMLVVKGAMTLLVDGGSYELGAGQLAIIPKGAVRGFTAGPDGFTMFAAHLKG